MTFRHPELIKLWNSYRSLQSRANDMYCKIKQSPQREFERAMLRAEIEKLKCIIAKYNRDWWSAYQDLLYHAYHNFGKASLIRYNYTVDVNVKYNCTNFEPDRVTTEPHRCQSDVNYMWNIMSECERATTEALGYFPINIGDDDR